MTDGQPEGERDFRMVDVPGYMEWSKRKLAAGESEALIAHLDATCMWLHPSELNGVTEQEFEEMLDDLKAGLEAAGDE